jgi:hypothetical protein
MHNRMTRILSAISLLVVIPTVAFASSSRVAGLGVPGDYIKDYTGMFTYVSGVSSVGNLIYAEPNTSPGVGGQAMGAVLGNLWEGRMGTWGLHLRQFSPALGQSMFGNSVSPTGSPGIFIADPNTNGEALDLMWGHKMGSGNLGLRYSRSFISDESPAGTSEGDGTFGRNVWGLGAGFGFAMNPNTDVEIAGDFQNRSFKGTADGVPSTAADDGGGTYLVAGRAFVKGGANVMWVPVARIYSFDLSSVSAAAVATDAKISGWEVGGAGNWSIGSDDLFVLGFQVVGNHAESTVGTGPKQEANETFYPNAFMAIETHVNSWLTLRFGAQNAVLYSLKTETGAPTVTNTIKQHVFDFNMGAGVKLGSLMLDATLADNFWNNPVGAVWNNGVGPQPFPRVSATYSF